MATKISNSRKPNIFLCFHLPTHPPKHPFSSSTQNPPNLVKQVITAILQNRPFDTHTLISPTNPTPRWTSQTISEVLRSIPRFFFQSTHSIGRQKGFRHRSPLKQRDTGKELNDSCKGCVQGTFVTFYISNKCSVPIWPATAANTGQPVIANGGFFLPSGQTKRVIAPYSWSGRFWARTGCNFNSSNSKPACETGDCEGKLACDGSIGLPPVTLVQVSVQSDKSKPSYYDVSLVDGYNIPVSISSRSKESSCNIGGCSKNLNSFCPHELQILNAQGKVVACKSACLAFNLDVFCCRNDYGSLDKCRPSMYSKMFKDACPSYFSYAYDTPVPLVSCSSPEYVVTFCPSKWGEHTEM